MKNDEEITKEAEVVVLQRHWVATVPPSREHMMEVCREAIRRAREDERGQIRDDGKTVRVCQWVEREDCWETQCSNEFVILEGTPKDNLMRFCAYCGGELLEDAAAIPAMVETHKRLTAQQCNCVFAEQDGCHDENCEQENARRLLASAGIEGRET